MRRGKPGLFPCSSATTLRKAQFDLAGVVLTPCVLVTMEMGMEISNSQVWEWALGSGIQPEPDGDMLGVFPVEWWCWAGPQLQGTSISTLGSGCKSGTGA